MVLEKIGEPLKLKDLPKPEPQEKEILIKVHVCAICRTDRHIVDNELPPPHLPLVLGHQIVGTVEKLGPKATKFSIGDRVGVPWLGGTDGTCSFCQAGKENLCDNAVFTGYHKNGGYAEYCTANEDYTFAIPKSYDDIHAAPLLCAGMIGYRAYRMTKNAKRIGFYGFGSSAHLLIQIALYEKKEVYAFTRKGDVTGQEFAKKLGATWAGDSEQSPPKPLDAAIIFAPAGDLYPTALKAVVKGGIVVSAGIHMSDIPSFPYSLLWEERNMCSVANLTRQDGRELLEIAPKVPIKTEVTVYPLEKANEALEDLKTGKFKGSGVLQIF